MQALTKQVNVSCCSHLTSWLKFGEDSVSRMKEGRSPNPSLSTHNQVSQINVLLQMEHILSYPFVKERVDNHQLHVHGWWFDIAQADVYCYEQEQNAFVLIDEKEAKLIMERLG